MSGAWSIFRPAPCALLMIVFLVGGLNGDAFPPSAETCLAVRTYCNRMENIINGYKETMARSRLRRRSWSEAELHYAEMPRLYADFNYLKRVDSVFSPSKPYKDHLSFIGELLLSYEFALDQVQLDLSLHPARNSIHIKKSTEIARELEQLQNQIHREAVRVNIIPSREDMELFLESSYIPQNTNDDRKNRHFLTLLELMEGLNYIKDMFSNC